MSHFAYLWLSLYKNNRKAYVTKSFHTNDYPQDWNVTLSQMKSQINLSIKSQNSINTAELCSDFRYDERVTAMLVDQGNNLYSCGVCNKESNRRADLMKHIINKHVTAPAVVCQFCNKQYKNQNSLQVHISQNHRDQWKRGGQFC